MATDKAALRAALQEADASAPNYDLDTLTDLLAERLDNPPDVADGTSPDSGPATHPDEEPG